MGQAGHAAGEVGAHLQKEAGGLAVLVAVDGAAGGVGGLGADADGRQREAVQHHGVPRPVHEPHGIVRRDAVQVVAGGMAALGESGVVVAPAAQPLAGRGLAGGRGDALPQVAQGAHGRGGAVEGEQASGYAEEVQMGVVEAGEERASAAVVAPGVGAGQPGGVGPVAEEEHAACPDAEGRRRGPRRVQGVDRGVVEDKVRGVQVTPL